MKTSLILMMMLAAGTLAAQPDRRTNEAATSAPTPHGVAGLLFQPEKPNEIIRGRVTYSGVAVQIIKTKKPLQLINPLAPPEYGYGSDNLDRDIITGKPNGFKLFSINF
ncbi:MAG TPA: hypothetical protein VG754_10575 [Verrucomicrobiae bacterium]|jgi:hypothetical protein|nr:hypothetical protein [Verrucomicrobiae bacterium]